MPDYGVINPPVAGGGGTATVPVPAYLAGSWFNLSNATSFSNVANATGQVRLTSFYLVRGITITDLGLYISTASSGGLIKAMIYSNSPTLNRPTGAPLAAVELSTTNTAGVSATLASAVSLTPGLYWMATFADNATVQCIGETQNGKIAAQAGASALNGLFPGVQVLYSIQAAATFTSGSYPDLTGAGFTNVLAASVVLAGKVSAVA